MRRRRRTPLVLLVAGVMALAGCGYHTTGKAVRLPPDVRTLYVPAFTNNTQAFRVDQVLTDAVVRELRSRTNFQVVLSASEPADATLRGTVLAAGTSPLTYDTQTGKVSSSMLQIVMRVSLIDRSGKILWENPGFGYRAQYELSQDAASFFEEESPALQRVAHEFAQSLVSNMLEAY